MPKTSVINPEFNVDLELRGVIHHNSWPNDLRISIQTRATSNPGTDLRPGDVLSNWKEKSSPLSDKEDREFMRFYLRQREITLKQLFPVV